MNSSKNPFKTIKSLQELFNLRHSLLKPFIKKFGKPVLIHAVHDESVFNKILHDSKIKLPNNHSSYKKTPYFERFIGNDNCIYYSLGFVYNTAHKWKFNFIFDIDFLRNLTYYNAALAFRCYKTIVDYWHDNDKAYHDKFKEYNKNTQMVMDKYYCESSRGIFEFWKAEKELFYFISKCKYKNKLFKMIRNIEKEVFMRYPYSKRNALAVCLKNNSPEILGTKTNNLLKNPYFIGFYIDGKINNKTKKILREKYSDKLFFDGKKFCKIKDLN